MSDRKRGRNFVLDIVWTAVLQIVSKARGIILLPIITHAGSDALYGAWSILFGLVSLVVPLSNLSLHQGLMRFAAPLELPAARALYVRVAWIGGAISVAAAALVAGTILILPPSVSKQLFGDYGSTTVLLVTCLHIPENALIRTNSCFLRSRGHVTLAQSTEVLGGFVATTAAALAFLFGAGLLGAQLAVLGVCLTHVVVFGIVCLTRADRRDGKALAETPSMRKVFAFSAPFVPNAICDWALYISDRYIIASWFGPSVAGVYAAAYALAQGLQMVSYPIEYALSPLLPRLWDGGERDEAARFVRGSFATMLWLFLAAIGALIPLGSFVLRKLGTPEMADEGGRLLPILAAGVLVFGLARILGLLMIVDGQARRMTRLIFVPAFVNVGLNLLIVPKLGNLGAAISTLVAYAIYLIAIVRAVRGLAKDLIDYARSARMLVAAGLAGLVLFVRPSGPVARFATAFAYVTVFVVASFLVRAVRVSEVKQIIQRVRARRAQKPASARVETEKPREAEPSAPAPGGAPDDAPDDAAR